MKLPEGNFLVPDATALIEAAVFLVVLVVIAKWVMPRVQATIDQSKRHIEGELHAASQISAEARKRAEQADELLRQARRDARVIRDRACEYRDYLVAEGKRMGREEYEWFSRTQRVPSQADAKELVAAAAASPRSSFPAGSAPAPGRRERLG